MAILRLLYEQLSGIVQNSTQHGFEVPICFFFLKRFIRVHIVQLYSISHKNQAQKHFRSL